ncbi:DUF2914 domain-containing protein [bacterium]|nr:MAG: DUF2914 domain-containing protein [bacterium]
MKKPLALLLLLAAPAIAAASQLSITRHAFTREIAGREPMDDRQVFKSTEGVVYFFNQIVYDGSPTEISHVWKYGGEVINEIPLHLEGPNWRTWSNTKVLPEQTGEWTVEVKADGEAVFSASFTVEK